MAIIVSPLLVPLTGTSEPSQSSLNSSRVDKSATAVAQTSLSSPKVSIWRLRLLFCSPGQAPTSVTARQKNTGTTTFDEEATLATTFEKRGKNSSFLTHMRT